MSLIRYIFPTSVIIIDKGEFALNLFKSPAFSNKFERIKTYRVAVGTDEYETPTGIYRVEKKGKRVDWMMPDSPWIPEELWGTIVPGGDPRNPIKSRWIEIYDGVGIHGTADLDSIGTEASHGCVRMRVHDVKELYDLVPKGSIVVVHE